MKLPLTFVEAGACLMVLLTIGLFGGIGIHITMGEAAGNMAGAAVVIFVIVSGALWLFLLMANMYTEDGCGHEARTNILRALSWTALRRKTYKVLGLSR